MVALTSFFRLPYTQELQMYSLRNCIMTLTAAAACLYGTPLKLSEVTVPGATELIVTGINDKGALVGYATRTP